MLSSMFSGRMDVEKYCLKFEAKFVISLLETMKDIILLIAMAHILLTYSIFYAIRKSFYHKIQQR